MEKPDICNVEKMKYEPLNNKDMKKLLGLITALYFGLASLNAMSYEEARDRARFLTDKMAYELNLNDQQYNDAYEINLDYLMNIRTASDASSVYLEYRNADLRFILYDWQYALFQAATYFFRPVIWRTSGWFLPVYTHLQPEPLLLQSTKGISGVQGRTLPLPARTSAELLCSPTPGMERRIERGKQRPVTGPAGPTSSSSRVAQRQRQPRFSFRITRQTVTTRPTSERPPRQWFPF